MADAPVAPGTAPLTDSRRRPRGVLPRGTQTWLMGGLALLVLVIILLTRRAEPPARPAPASTAPQTANPDRVREYQDRLRSLETRVVQEAQAATNQTRADATTSAEPRTPPPEDPIAAERKRRDYDSLFASNVVLSRRPDAERPDGGRTPPGHARLSADAGEADTPSIEEIADAAVRATVRASAGPGLSTAAASPGPTNAPPPPASSSAETTRRERTDPISAAGPVHPILEGTIIDTVLTNRLDGSAASPVNCLVTNPLYSHSGQQVLIPAGARILGETKPVQTMGESRLAVVFHRLVMPDGRTHSLDQFLGLNQIGDAGLRDRVNQHYWSTFGAAAAVGLISGLAQFVGTAGISEGHGDHTVIIAGGAADATSQASLQVMNRFLNRLPTITIREGHRVKVYLTSDLELPAYEARRRGQF
jgi:type IV secretory pathway VirB10-like protein